MDCITPHNLFWVMLKMVLGPRACGRALNGRCLGHRFCIRCASFYVDPWKRSRSTVCLAVTIHCLTRRASCQVAYFALALSDSMDERLISFCHPVLLFWVREKYIAHSLILRGNLRGHYEATQQIVEALIVAMQARSVEKLIKIIKLLSN